MAQSLTELVKDHLDAFNARDWNRYKSTLTDDALYAEEATQRRAKSPDQIVDLLKGWAKAFPDLRGTVKEVVASGDRAVAEVLWEGTHYGILPGPLGDLPATGKKGQVLAVEVFSFEGGRISEIRHFFDVMTILVQIGAMPAATAQQPRP